MNTLQAGFSRVDITPPPGTEIIGYFHPRYAEGILDHLEINTPGPVAMLGIPGEPFNGIGLGIKEAKGWEVVMPTCLTNGSEGYFPMQDSYDEGGYEARSSRYKADTAELIIEEGKALLDTLH